MSIKFTVALRVLNTDLHITLVYISPTEQLPKVRTSADTGYVEVTAVEYWADAGVTVALVEGDVIERRFDYWQYNGYGYDHPKGFNPHFTIGAGDLTQENADLVGAVFMAGQEYFRIYEEE